MKKAHKNTDKLKWQKNMNLPEKERRGEGLKREREEGGEMVREERKGRIEEAMGTTLTIGVWMRKKRREEKKERRIIGIVLVG